MASEFTARVIKYLGYIVPVVAVLLAIALILPAIQMSRAGPSSAVGEQS